MNWLLNAKWTLTAWNLFPPHSAVHYVSAALLLTAQLSLTKLKSGMYDWLRMNWKAVFRLFPYDMNAAPICTWDSDDLGLIPVVAKQQIYLRTVKVLIFCFMRTAAGFSHLFFFLFVPSSCLFHRMFHFSLFVLCHFPL